jgi:hypothetical protein
VSDLGERGAVRSTLAHLIVLFIGPPFLIGSFGWMSLYPAEELPSTNADQYLRRTSLIGKSVRKGLRGGKKYLARMRITMAEQIELLAIQRDC